MQNRLKELRKAKKLSLVSIEKQTGIKRSTFSDYENGKTEPKLETWDKLANFFHVPLWYLQGQNANALDNTDNLDDKTIEELEQMFIKLTRRLPKIYKLKEPFKKLNDLQERSSQEEEELALKNVQQLHELLVSHSLNKFQSSYVSESINLLLSDNSDGLEAMHLILHFVNLAIDKSDIFSEDPELKEELIGTLGTLLDELDPSIPNGQKDTSDTGDEKQDK